LNGTSREVIAETTTDSNGYYAFDHPDIEMIVQFIKPDAYQFTKPDVGDDDRDSDADSNGETKVFQADSTAARFAWDAGLTLPMRRRYSTRS
jgi:hypothetical protein